MNPNKNTISPYEGRRPGLLDHFRKGIGPGSIIRGRGSYKILRLLGKGGMGEVFLAEKEGAYSFSKLMAIKVLPKVGIAKIDGRMFLDEARLTAGLNHPNIIQVYQLGETRAEFFIIMEHVFGITLLELLERHNELSRGIPVDMGVFIFVRILSGLHYAHNKANRDGEHLGIVHRDICPSNVLISFRGIPKLSDFGVAKARTSLNADEKRIVFGKYPYMAPEQVNREGTEPRSDLYSLGLVMYEVFTGRVAHEVDDTKMLLENLEGTELPSPKEIDPTLPKNLSAIIMKAIATKKEDRFESAKEMRIALEEFIREDSKLPEQDDLAEYLCGLFPQAEKHRWW